MNYSRFMAEVRNNLIAHEEWRLGQTMFQTASEIPSLEVKVREIRGNIDIDPSVKNENCLKFLFHLYGNKGALKFFNSDSGRMLFQKYGKNMLPKGFSFYVKEDKELVDFEAINNFFEEIENLTVFHDRKLNTEEVLNIQLFLKKLKESSSFAHKAHKELKKLG